jgi:hypothetical protein
VTAGERPTGIDLFWLPLGAGGHCVWWNGRIYEAIAARLARRRVCDLYHSALEVRVPDGEVETGRRLLALASSVPTPVWGRDQLRAGEMWNSNSVIAWLVASSGLDAGKIHPPRGGRAPGWEAGLVVALRSGS